MGVTSFASSVVVDCKSQEVMMVMMMIMTMTEGGGGEPKGAIH